MAKLRVKINTKDLRDFTKNLHDTIDYSKVLQSFMDGMNSRLLQKHGRQYTYQTPTIGMPKSKSSFGDNGSAGRANVRRRSGRLIQAIRNARFTKSISKNQYEAGYSLPQILSAVPYAKLHINTNEDGKITYTTLTPRTKYFSIPLNAALNSNGTLKVQPPRYASFYRDDDTGGIARSDTENKSKVIYAVGNSWVKLSYEDALMQRYDFSGENTKKFKKNSQVILSTRDRRPYFVLAKKIKIPARITLQKELADGINAPNGYYSLQNRLQTEINRLLRKVSKK